jgi:hypothetical protein
MKKTREIQHSFVFGGKDRGDEILFRAGWSQHVFMRTDYGKKPEFPVACCRDEWQAG